MAQEMRDVPDGPHFTNRERLALIGHVDKLSRCIGGAERIHQTVVPLNYARHTLRALTIWLVTFPTVALRDLRLLTGPSMFLITWMLFGIFQIGKTCYRFAEDTLLQSLTAIVCLSSGFTHRYILPFLLS